MSRPLEHGDYDRCYLSDSIQAWPRERELSRRAEWISHVVPALGLLAGFGMWAWAVIRLLMLTWGGGAR
jgi:hypothetical protein